MIVGKWESGKVERNSCHFPTFPLSHFSTFPLSHPVLKNPICGGVRYKNSGLINNFFRSTVDFSLSKFYNTYQNLIIVFFVPDFERMDFHVTFYERVFL